MTRGAGWTVSVSALVWVLAGCGLEPVNVEEGGADDGGAPASGGNEPGGESGAGGGDEAGASASDGGDGSGGALTGGVTASGGRPTGGTAGLGGVAAGGSTPATGGMAGAPGTGGAGVTSCDVVGCAAPPLCADGCSAQCGCCACVEGEAIELEGVKHQCVGGCWAPADAACEWQGEPYRVGETFPARDGCNTCVCQADGAIACTEMVCPTCDPAAETNRREYVSTDPVECALIDYLCVESTRTFNNDCGCGCEQSADCPDWIDCMPGSADAACADLEAFAARCPYTGVAW